MKISPIPLNLPREKLLARNKICIRSKRAYYFIHSLHSSFKKYPQSNNKNQLDKSTATPVDIVHTGVVESVETSITH
jgi:hypothetical protein